MEGVHDKPDNFGIIPRTFEHVFKTIGGNFIEMGKWKLFSVFELKL